MPGMPFQLDIVETGEQKPMTNQVTTTPGSGRRSATQLNADNVLACSNPTRSDPARRDRQAWHAEGQGFESP